MLRSQPFHEFLQVPDEQKKKLLWLASTVNEAKQRADNDPNKLAVLVMTLDRFDKQRIEQLKPILGLKSREAVMKYALDALHKRHILTRKQS